MRVASAIFYEGLVRGFPTMRVFTFKERELRTAFYQARLAAGLDSAPKRSPGTKKLLWGDVVGLQRTHDARHIYAVVQVAGLDGEKPRAIRFIAGQLGHVDQNMVVKIYGKATIEQTLELAREEIAAGGKAVQNGIENVTAPRRAAVPG
jgi:integrase